MWGLSPVMRGPLCFPTPQSSLSLLLGSLGSGWGLWEREFLCEEEEAARLSFLLVAILSSCAQENMVWSPAQIMV